MPAGEANLPDDIVVLHGARTTASQGAREDLAKERVLGRKASVQSMIYTCIHEETICSKRLPSVLRTNEPKQPKQSNSVKRRGTIHRVQTGLRHVD